MPQFKLKIQNEGDNCQLIIRYRDITITDTIIDVTFDCDIVNINGRVDEIFVRKDPASQKIPLARRSLFDRPDPRNVNRIHHYQHFFEDQFSLIAFMNLTFEDTRSISIKAVEMSE